jgi:hypothetical protein
MPQQTQKTFHLAPWLAGWPEWLPETGMPLEDPMD